MASTAPPDLKKAGPEAQYAAVLEMLAALGEQTSGFTASEAAAHLGLSKARAGDLLLKAHEAGAAVRSRPHAGAAYVYLANRGPDPLDLEEGDPAPDENDPEMIARRSLEELQRRDRDAGARACRKCGCTDRYACAAGCSWVDADLCSSCGTAQLGAPATPDDQLEATLAASLEAAAAVDPGLAKVCRDAEADVLDYYAGQDGALGAAARAEQARRAEAPPTQPAPAPAGLDAPPEVVDLAVAILSRRHAKGAACPHCGATEGQPHGYQVCTAAAALLAAQHDQVAAVAAQRHALEFEDAPCPHVLVGGRPCALRRGHNLGDNGTAHEAAPSPAAIEASRAKQEAMAARVLDQARQALHQVRHARQTNEEERERILARTTDAVVRGHAAGLTYEQLAEDAGLSRARVGELLREHREAGT